MRTEAQNMFERGNGVIDLLLFMPLALFFLFAAASAGAGYVEKGAASDVLRAGLNTVGGAIRGGSAAILTAEYEPLADAELMEQAAQNAAAEISRRFQSSRWVQRGEEETYIVETAVLSVCVNPETGRLCGPAFQVIAAAEDPGAAAPGSARGSSGRSQYVTAELIADQDSVPSRFAVPMGMVYRADRPEQRGLRYQPFSLLLYGEVRSSVSGLGGWWPEKVLGRQQLIQEQALQLIRRQMQ